MRRSDHGLDTPRGPHWTDRALCRQLIEEGLADPDLWYPTRDDQSDGMSSVYGKPRRVCRSCPVWQECRDYALEHDERYGMWGGLSPLERRRLAQAVA
ncbi:WhiB family transcriptional regulator [Nonomuraea sp. KM90]|uniref:WhiB family transcriptional regulator n=1 Tax=Nonomuraea sp. KM90 TaxID=3457428 RepID=UPI003FCE65AF